MLLCVIRLALGQARRSSLRSSPSMSGAAVGDAEKSTARMKFFCPDVVSAPAAFASALDGQGGS
ncbi:hypothetical protein WMF37_42400 [Sorangium sp. So ce291]|uniref:hypothetical protein n=1 Tax=Sorangium sp. So ce291 TaxID=3133294 RepID=UPI003F6024B5